MLRSDRRGVVPAFCRKRVDSGGADRSEIGPPCPEMRDRTIDKNSFTFQLERFGGNVSDSPTK